MRQRLLSFQRLLPIIGVVSLCRIFWAKLLRKPFVQLRVKGVKSPVVARLNNSDLSVLYQVFGLRECETAIDSPRAIIDGGANVGYASLFYAERYPRATILAVEPSDQNCEVFTRNCGAHSNVRLIRGGIWNKRALLEMCDAEQRGWMIQVRATEVRTAATMEAYTIPDLIALSGQTHIDILKLDIEGTEELLFSEGDLSWVDQVGCLIIETHGATSHALVSKAMKARGFKQEVSGEKCVFTKD